MSVEFLVTSLIVVVTPGAGVLFTLVTGLSHGARASLVAAVGCTLGIVPHVLAAATGLAALMHASALAFQVLKYLGVAYLLYMAWTMARTQGTLAVREEVAPRSEASVILSGVLVNVLNPKLTLFFFAFLPQFVGVDDGDALPRMLELSGVFMVLTLVIFAVYGVLAAAVRDRVLGRPRVMAWMRGAFAGTFVVLSGRLALADR